MKYSFYLNDIICVYVCVCVISCSVLGSYIFITCWLLLHMSFEILSNYRVQIQIQIGISLCIDLSNKELKMQSNTLWLNIMPGYTALDIYFPRNSWKLFQMAAFQLLSFTSGQMLWLTNALIGVLWCVGRLVQLGT